MPDYSFSQLYESPIKLMVDNGEIEPKMFEQVKQFLEPIFSFHHNGVSPIIFLTNYNNIIIVLCNERANMRLVINNSCKDEGSVTICTTNGFEIFDGRIASISAKSLRSILARLF